MTASKYAEQFILQGRTIEALLEVIRAMIIEVSYIGRKKGIYDDNAFLLILDSQERKFRRFIIASGGKLDNGASVHDTAFRRLLREALPERFAAWNRHKGGTLLVGDPTPPHVQ